MRPPIEILLVDDNPADIDLVLYTLTKTHTPYRTATAHDGEEALSLLHREGSYEHAIRPDLIFLDLNLPKKGGRAVLAEAKSDPELKHIPIVIFSTSQAGTDIVGAYTLGANSYVRKPGNLTDFTAVVLAMTTYWMDCAQLPSSEI